MSRKFMIWTGLQTSRANNELLQYGRKFTQVGLFDFTVQSNGSITGAPTSTELQAVQMYPQVKWFLTVQALGSKFKAIMDNTNGAQDRFISEIQRLMSTYPWCAGIDCDFEQVNDSTAASYKSKAVALYQRIYNTVHAAGKLVHVDLPGMTGPGESLGGELWCDYAQLAPYFDTCTIMTYGYSWVGSAPAPIAPASWVSAVYDYAVTVIPPEKIYLGVAGYGLRWAIHADLATLATVRDSSGNYVYSVDGSSTGPFYRGQSGTYYAWLAWMLGAYNHYDESGGRQPYIPWASFWDDTEKSAWMLLHVYDYQTPDDAKSISYPTAKDYFNGWPFTSAYNKVQVPSFTGLVVQKSAGQATKKGGALVDNGSNVFARQPQPLLDQNGKPTGQTEPEGYAQYTFTVPASGNYAIVLHVNFPWWDVAKVGVYLDGTLDESTGQVSGGQALTVQQPSQWYPLARTDHWIQAATVNLSAGTHTLTFSGAISDHGAQFFGFAVAQGFSFTMDGGTAQYTLVPQDFRDVNGNIARPASGYVVSLEVLRHPPEYAMVWSDDWRTYPGGHDSLDNWYTKSGSWNVQGTYQQPSTLVGSGQLTIKYSGFTDLCVYADFSFTGSEAGIVMGSNKIGLTSNGRVVFNGATLGTANTSGSHRLRVRCRQGTYTVWLDGVLIGTTSGSGSNTFGLYTASGAQIRCTALYAGDAYWMMPEEAVTITTPSGTETVGRIQRTGVTWDNTWGFFQVPNGTEEYNTRQGTAKDISMDWDYLNSQSIPLAANVPVTIKAADTGVWVRRVFLCDKDGASIAYYCDRNYFRYWADEADKRGLAGTAMWQLGLEDPKIFDLIPDNL